MQKLIQSLQNNLKPEFAKILLNALQESNDESFFAFVLENLQSIISWLNSKEFQQLFNTTTTPPITIYLCLIPPLLILIQANTVPILLGI